MHILLLFVTPENHPNHPPNPRATRHSTPTLPANPEQNPIAVLRLIPHQLSRMSIKSYYRRLKPIYDLPGPAAANCSTVNRALPLLPEYGKWLRRGRRQTKHESIQLYLCEDCRKTFSPRIIKHKQYPLKVILDAISFYNLGLKHSFKRSSPTFAIFYR